MSASSPAPGAGANLRDFAGPLVLVGAGKMGGSLLDGWLRAGLAPERVTVIEPEPSKRIAALATHGVRLNPKPAALSGAAALVFAVKPQIADQATAALAPLAGKSTLVISIMAGRTLEFLSAALPNAGAVVRAMPNAPAAIGRGTTVAVPLRTSADQRALADRLLAATGAVTWIEDETLMDAVTAVSGSGPAYVFLLAEALTQAGVAAGLPRRLADTLARQTIAGSGELLHRSSLSAAKLREIVTSPGGTTAAALDILMAKDGLTALMKKAVAAATERSRKLAG